LGFSLVPEHLIGEGVGGRRCLWQGIRSCSYIDPWPGRSHQRSQTYRRNYHREFSCSSCSVPGRWMYSPHSSSERGIPLGYCRVKRKSVDMSTVHK
jgi:hypothetical protein